jgi:hypothetical protein
MLTVKTEAAPARTSFATKGNRHTLAIWRIKEGDWPDALANKDPREKDPREKDPRETDDMISKGFNMMKLARHEGKPLPRIAPGKDHPRQG